MRDFERGSGMSVTGPRVTWNAAKKAVAGAEQGTSGGGLRFSQQQPVTWFGRCPSFKPQYGCDERRGRFAHADD